MPARTIAELLPALMSERGAVVCSADCGEMEIAFAMSEDRFFVDFNGVGFVLRPRDWLANAEQLVFDSKDLGKHDTDIYPDPPAIVEED